MLDDGVEAYGGVGCFGGYCRVGGGAEKGGRCDCLLGCEGADGKGGMGESCQQNFCRVY